MGWNSDFDRAVMVLYMDIVEASRAARNIFFFEALASDKSTKVRQIHLLECGAKVHESLMIVTFIKQQ